MALRKTHGDREPQPVTSVDEIRRRKGLLFDDFTAEYPDWEWSERRRKRLMFDAHGRAWVPTWNPEYGVGIAYDESGFTPEAEDYLIELARKAREQILAGGGDVFDPDAPDDD